MGECGVFRSRSNHYPRYGQQKTMENPSSARTITAVISQFLVMTLTVPGRANAVTNMTLASSNITAEVCLMVRKLLSNREPFLKKLPCCTCTRNDRCGEACQGGRQNINHFQASYKHGICEKFRTI